MVVGGKSNLIVSARFFFVVVSTAFLSDPTFNWCIGWYVVHTQTSRLCAKKRLQCFPVVPAWQLEPEPCELQWSKKESQSHDMLRVNKKREKLFTVRRMSFIYDLS